jgi:hypothetical protein
MRKVINPTAKRSSSVDLRALAKEMSPSAQEVFEDRSAAHVSARFIRRIREKAGLTQE